MSTTASRFFSPVVPVSHAAALSGGIDTGPIEQAGSEVNTLNFEIQQLEQMASGIANLTDVAESLNGRQGFDANVFSVIDSQARHIVEGTGLNPTNVNMQSFDDGDNSGVSSVCMQGLAATAKNIWNAIIKAIKDLFAKITQWFAKITNQVPTLIKKFEKLRDAAREKSAGLKEDKDKITLPSSVVKTLGEGKTPKVSLGIIKGVSANLRSIAARAKAGNELSDDTTSTILTAMKNVSVNSNKDFITTLETLTAALNKAAGNNESLQDGTTPDKALNAKLGLPEFSDVTPLGFGNRAAILKLYTDGSASKTLNNLVKSFSRQPNVDPKALDSMDMYLTESLKDAKVTMTIGAAIPNIDDAESDEIDTLTSSIVTDICTEVILALEEIKTFKEDHEKASRKMTKFTNEIVKTAEKIENANVDSELSKAKTMTSKVVKSFADLFKGFAQFTPQAGALTISAANALYTVGSLSVAAHK